MKKTQTDRKNVNETTHTLYSFPTEQKKISKILKIIYTEF